MTAKRWVSHHRFLMILVCRQASFSHLPPGLKLPTGTLLGCNQVGDDHRNAGHTLLSRKNKNHFTATKTLAFANVLS